MRLYLDATSKNGIGYTPDTLIVENNGKRYEYDIQGTTDYGYIDLATRTKGDLLIRNDRLDKYLELTNKGKQRLLDLLRDKSSTVIISIYPIPADEPNTDLVYNDILDKGNGRLEFGDDMVDFHFFTEFYGF